MENGELKISDWPAREGGLDMGYGYFRGKLIANVLVVIACYLLLIGSAATQSLDEVYQRAKKEGRVVVYAPLSAKTEEIVFPAFRRCVAGSKFRLPVSQGLMPVGSFIE